MNSYMWSVSPEISVSAPNKGQGQGLYGGSATLGGEVSWDSLLCVFQDLIPPLKFVVSPSCSLFSDSFWDWDMCDRPYGLQLRPDFGL
jgi:hypothetical protein